MTTHSIDRMTMHSSDRFTNRPDVRSFFARRVDCDPRTTFEVLIDSDPLGPVADALTALGLERIEWLPAVRERGRAVSFGAIVRLADSGIPLPAATFDWYVEVADDGDGGSVLEMSVEATANDAASRERLLDGWPVIGALLEHQCRRMLVTFAELAERDAFVRAAAPVIPSARQLRIGGG